jgi:hypothetical protein
MKRIIAAIALTFALAAPSEGQYGAGVVCVGPLAKEEQNHVRMSREGCDGAITIALADRSWLWADGWITAQEAYVWARGTGEPEQHWMGRYQHELPSEYEHRGTIILACASAGPRLGRGHGWVGVGGGLCLFTGTGNLGAPMFAPTLTARAQGSVTIGGLELGIRPHLDALIPQKRGTTVFQEWAYCERGTIGNGCDFKETGHDWRVILGLYLTAER